MNGQALDIATLPALSVSYVTDDQPGAVTWIGFKTKQFVSLGAKLGEQRRRALGAARAHKSAGRTEEDTIEAIWCGLQHCEQNPADPWTYSDAVKIVRSIWASKPPPLMRVVEPSPTPSEYDGSDQVPSDILAQLEQWKARALKAEGELETVMQIARNPALPVDSRIIAILSPDVFRWRIDPKRPNDPFVARLPKLSQEFAIPKARVTKGLKVLTSTPDSPLRTVTHYTPRTNQLDSKGREITLDANTKTVHVLCEIDDLRRQLAPYKPAEESVPKRGGYRPRKPACPEHGEDFMKPLTWVCTHPDCGELVTEIPPCDQVEVIRACREQPPMRNTRDQSEVIVVTDNHNLKLLEDEEPPDRDDPTDPPTQDGKCKHCRRPLLLSEFAGDGHCSACIQELYQPPPYDYVPETDPYEYIPAGGAG